jgi:hypothetical protein
MTKKTQPSQDHEDAEVLSEEGSEGGPNETHDPATGEMLPPDPDQVPAPPPGSALVRVETPYIAPSTVPVTETQMKVLLREVRDDQIEIRPDGMVFVPGVIYRRTLNEAFGPMGWSLVPLERWYDQNDNMAYLRGALFVGGRFVAEAVGEHAYLPSNRNSNYGTALESAKTNCLSRCCKDLGMFSELWDPKFLRVWRDQHAVQAWCEGQPGSQEAGKRKPLWRLKSAPPIDVYPWKEQPQGGASGGKASGQGKPSSGKARSKEPEPEPEPAKLPSRPWDPMYLATIVQAKAGAMQRQDASLIHAELTEETFEELSMAMAREWPELDQDGFEGILDFLLGRQPGREGVSQVEALALLSWLGSTKSDVKVEALRVLRHLGLAHGAAA